MYTAVQRAVGILNKADFADRTVGAQELSSARRVGRPIQMGEVIDDLWIHRWAGAADGRLNVASGTLI
jgi:hypothetical protein